MHINIDRLTEDELHDLHHRVTERLRVIRELRAHGSIMRFSIGDRVAFVADGRRVVGVLTRYNRKSVTVLADGGDRWNVSPGLLQLVERRAAPSNPPSTIVVPSLEHGLQTIFDTDTR